MFQQEWKIHFTIYCNTEGKDPIMCLPFPFPIVTRTWEVLADWVFSIIRRAAQRTSAGRLHMLDIPLTATKCLDRHTRRNMKYFQWSAAFPNPFSKHFYRRNNGDLRQAGAIWKYPVPNSLNMSRDLNFTETSAILKSPCANLQKAFRKIDQLETWTAFKSLVLRQQRGIV